MRLLERFDNRSNYIDYGSWVGSKTKEQNVAKGTSLLVCRSFQNYTGSGLLFGHVTHFK